MSTCLSSDLKVSQEETLHVSLGSVIQVNKRPKVINKSSSESQPKNAVPKRRKTSGSKRKCKNVCKGSASGKGKLQVRDVHVDPSTDDKVSTPKNANNMQNISNSDENAILSTPKNASSTENETGADANRTQQTSVEGSGVAESNNNTDEKGDRLSSTQESPSIPNDNATNLDRTQETSMDTSVTPENVDSTPVIDISQSNDEMLNLLKVNKQPRCNKPAKPRRRVQLRTDVAYGTNFNSFKNKEPVFSAVDFSKAFNKLFARTEVIMDDGNQLCTCVVNYLQLSPQNIRTSVMQYILHNMKECRDFAKKFNFRKIYINFDRATSQI